MVFQQGESLQNMDTDVRSVEIEMKTGKKMENFTVN